MVRTRDVLVALVGVAGVAALDRAQGTQGLLVFPLFYFPIAWAGLRLGSAWTAAVCVLASSAWVMSVLLEGADPGPAWAFSLNFLAQSASFLVVGGLVHALAQRAEREREVAARDPLTELHNRRAFRAQAEAWLRANGAERRAYSVVYIDLDNFKALNDRFGHAAGDEVLVALARALRSHVRQGDIVARIGGDEFALFLPGLSPERAQPVLERLREGTAAVLAGRDCPATISLGAATGRAGETGLEALLKRADDALYRSKGEGKDRLSLDAQA